MMKQKLKNDALWCKIAKNLAKCFIYEAHINLWCVFWTLVKGPFTDVSAQIFTDSLECLVSKLKWKICGSWQNQCGYWGTLLFFVSGLLEERELCCVDITQWKIIVVLAAISIQLYLFSIFCGDKFVMNGTTRDYTRHQIGPGGFKLRRTFKGMNGYFTAFYRM